MIKVVVVDGFNFPRLHCDMCEEEIQHVSQGAAVFRNFMQPHEESVPMMVHKDFVNGGCLKQAETLIRRGGARPGWVELGEHLACVLYYLGMGGKELEAYLARV